MYRANFVLRRFPCLTSLCNRSYRTPFLSYCEHETWIIFPDSVVPGMVYCGFMVRLIGALGVFRPVDYLCDVSGGGSKRLVGMFGEARQNSGAWYRYL